MTFTITGWFFERETVKYKVAPYRIGYLYTTASAKDVKVIAFSSAYLYILRRGKMNKELSPNTHQVWTAGLS